MPRTHALRQPLVDPSEWRTLHCSFCGKDADKIRFLTAGVFGGMICDRCCFKAFFIVVKAHLGSVLRATSS